MATLTFELGIDSSTAIELNVKYNTIISKQQMRSAHRTLSGNLYIYRWSNFIKHKINVDFMQSSNAAIINSWWETNTELLLFVTSDGTTEVQSVMLLNKDFPMNKYVKPYNIYLSGKLQLESY